jgi:hypothetical protein
MILNAGVTVSIIVSDKLYERKIKLGQMVNLEVPVTTQHSRLEGACQQYDKLHKIQKGKPKCRGGGGYH